MWPERARELNFRGSARNTDLIDGARPCVESELTMDGPNYLYAVVIAARRRMDRHFGDKNSSTQPRWLRQLVSEPLTRWYLRLVGPRRGDRRPDANRSRIATSDPPTALRVLVARGRPRDGQSLIDENDRLRDALRALQPEDYQLLMMRHVDQTSAAQIAAALKISENSAKFRLLRALLRLRSLTEDRPSGI